MATLDERIAGRAAQQHGAFSERQAAFSGGTRAMIRHRVRVGRWRRLAPGVYALAGSPPTWHQRLWAAMLEAGRESVASHRSAAALLGIPGYRLGPVEVTLVRGSNHRVTLGTLHETSWLPDAHVTEIEGVPCTTLPRTIFDLAAVEREGRVVRAFDDSMARLGLTVRRQEEVVAVLGRRGRPGTAAMRRLVASRGDGYVPTESELEALAVEVLVARDLPAPARQVSVWGGDRPVGRVDLGYPGTPVLIEAQSRRHHLSLPDWEADLARIAEAAAGGWAMIPVTWYQLVHEPDDFVRRVRQALERVRAGVPAVDPVAP
jgi:hypothetical protein